jgi:hypothetical protein
MASLLTETRRCAEPWCKSAVYSAIEPASVLPGIGERTHQVGCAIFATARIMGN